MASQEGLEPPTCGFGDRRSTSWSYWPRKYGGWRRNRTTRPEGTGLQPVAGPARLIDTTHNAPAPVRDARLLWGVESRADSGRKATPSGVRGSGGRGRSRTCFERFCRPPPSRSATRPEPRAHVTRTGRTNMEQAAGIEPASRAWKARAQATMPHLRTTPNC